MNFDQFLKNILGDLRVELAEQFDRNFERKSYFGTPWAPTKRSVTRGSLMIRSGALRASIQGRVTGNAISFTSSLPYARIHNEGGHILVTPKMKRYFWAMYMKAAGGITKTKSGAARNTKANAALGAEAGFYKAMALKKVGDKIKIPQRQFLGHHPQIDRIVREIVDANVQEVAKEIAAQLKRFRP